MYRDLNRSDWLQFLHRTRQGAQTAPSTLYTGGLPACPKVVSGDSGSRLGDPVLVFFSAADASPEHVPTVVEKERFSVGAGGAGRDRPGRAPGAGEDAGLRVGLASARARGAYSSKQRSITANWQASA